MATLSEKINYYISPRIMARRFIHKFAFLISDRMYLQMEYYLLMRKKLHLSNPKTYTEKIQWLKLYNRKPEYVKMVDKVGAKEYVSSIIGDEYIIPTIAVFDRVEDIEWKKLPQQFVIKCTHDSGGIVVCKDKSKLDIEDSIKKLKVGLQQDYYLNNREWPYKQVPRRLICEQYMVDESGYELKDYKIFCFDGEPKLLFVATDRTKGPHETKFDFFDLDWNHLPFTNGHPNNPNLIKKPENFAKMLEIARELSKGIPHVRIDLYNINGKVYFGEMTFFHWSGFVPFKPEDWDEKIGSLLRLPKQKIE